MISFTRHLLLLLLPVLLSAAETPKVRPINWAQPIIDSTLENFYRVSDDLYRSEQPKPADLPDLKAIGIKTVLSLRHYHHDSREFDQAGITTVQHEMDAGSVTVPDLITVLRIIRTGQKPILLHCWHGSDRTGFAIAGYRMVFMDWSAADAIEELRQGGYGYHASLYPNIAKVLQKMDVAAVKKAVFSDAPARAKSAAAPPETK